MKKQANNEVLFNLSKSTTKQLEQIVFTDIWDTNNAIKKQRFKNTLSIDRDTFEQNQIYAMFSLRVLFKSCVLELVKRYKDDNDIKYLQKYYKDSLKEFTWK